MTGLQRRPRVDASATLRTMGHSGAITAFDASDRTVAENPAFCDAIGHSTVRLATALDAETQWSAI